MKIKVPCGGFEKPVFIEVVASKVVIKGFEEFEFVAHGRVRADFKSGKREFIATRDGWTIAGLPSGCAVPGQSMQTKSAAIKHAEETLKRAGIDEVRKGFKKAYDLLKVKKRRLNALPAMPRLSH